MSSDSKPHTSGSRQRRSRKKRSSHTRSHNDPNERTLSKSHYINLILVSVFALAFVLFAANIMRKATRELKTASPQPSQKKETPATPHHVEPQTVSMEQRLRDWDGALDAAGDVQRLIDKRAFSEARARAEEALQKTPESMDLQLAYAQALVELSSHQDAKNALIKILSQDPHHATARLILAELSLATRDYASALTLARWILDAEPYNKEAQKIIAMSYIHTDQPTLAIPHLKRIVKNDPQNMILQNELAKALSKIGEHHKATELLEDVLEKDSSVSLSYYNLSVCYADQSRAQDAVNMLRQAAHKFGNTFVSAWIDSRDFDTVRDEDVFVDFIGLLSPKNPTTSSMSQLQPKKLTE